MDFVDEVRVMGLLPVAWIPAMDYLIEPRKSKEPLTPAPSQAMGSAVTKHPLPRLAKPMGLPPNVIMAERQDSDVEVEVLVPQAPKNKGKGWMCDDLPIPMLFPLFLLSSPVLNMTLNCINYAS